MGKQNQVTDQQIIDAYARLGNKAAVARELGMARSSVSERITKLGDTLPSISGRRDTIPYEERELPGEGKVKRYVLSCAQNNTKVDAKTWDALRLVCDHYKAEMLVARFTYNKGAYARQVKPDTNSDEDRDKLWYDAKITDYVCDQRIKLAPGLVFCGEMQMLPTAIDPLGGFETYTGRQSGIFPHAQLSMKSVPSAKHEPTKFNFTTGTVTQRNYLQARAGLRAEWHHTYGALLVEVNDKGQWWVRQLQVDEDGAVHDLSIRFDGKTGIVEEGHPVKALNYGDIHATALEDWMAEATWGEGGMLDQLRPEYQFAHDLVDIHCTNHHAGVNPHARFARFVSGHDSATDDLVETAGVLDLMERTWCQTVVVNSNHDNWLSKWLCNADYRSDPENAMFFLEAQLECYRAIETKNRDFSIVEWAMRKYGTPDSVRFLKEDESFIICKGKEGGIECGMHGHLGPNGSRGNPRAFSRSGRRTNTGHTHDACIIKGSWVAGVKAALDQGYNKGLSSWSHTDIVTHTNGKRQMITFWDGKWRA